MAFDIKLAEKIRKRLDKVTGIKVEEKKIFGGLAFMVNDKMCINASGNNLMCRYNRERQKEVEMKKGFLQMVMRGKAMDGYCYVTPDGFETKTDFEYWVKLCLDFNDAAKPSKKKQI